MFSERIWAGLGGQSYVAAARQFLFRSDSSKVFLNLRSDASFGSFLAVRVKSLSRAVMRR